MAKLDETRHSSVCGLGTMQFYRQDGKYFDMATLKEIDPATIPKPVEEKSSLICKFCGEKKPTPELMKEHLLAMHKDEMKLAKEEPETPEKKCPYCGAKKRPDAKEFEWQFACECDGAFQTRGLQPETPEPETPEPETPEPETPEPETPEPEPETWRQTAKRLGIKTGQRRKVDVLAEIAAKTAPSE